MDLLKTNKKWTYPALFILLLTPFSAWLDLAITRFFYNIGNDPVEHFVSSPLTELLFLIGPMPANLFALGAAFLLIGSWIFQSLKKWRNPALVLLLSYAIGAGLIVNGILKEYWGRPRPKQVEEFGGTQSFRPYYSPNFHQPQPSKSFPCGHCASGFYFFALGILGLRLNKSWLTMTGFALALIFGITLSLSRMAQGGHFLTDTLFAALIMWYTALAFDWLVYEGEGF